MTVLLVVAAVPVLVAVAAWLATSREAPRTPRRSASRSALTQRRDRVLALVAVTIGLAIGIASRVPAAGLVAALAIWQAPRLLGSRARAASDIARTEAVATWTEMLRDALSGPSGLDGAIATTAPHAPEAIRPQVAALAARLSRGNPPDALKAFATEVDHPVADTVVGALLVAYQCPSSRLGALLSALASSARSDASLRLRVDTARARMRTGMRVIVVTMAATVTAVALVSPAFLARYQSLGGQGVIVFIAATWALALTWMATLAHLREPDRLFGKELG